MKQVITGSAGIALLLLFGGCSNITLLRIEELKQVQARVDSLHADLAKMQKETIENQNNQTEMLRVIRADQQVRFDQLDGKVSALESSISESQMRLSKIDEKTREIRERWEERAKADSLMEETRNAEIEKLFQIAYSDFTAGRYDIALNGFQDIVNRFPESTMAEEAAYWIAECFYVRKKFAEAEKEYISYIKSYPQGTRICAALYKLGLVYEQQNKRKSREMVWTKLLNQCPDSDETRAAKSRMGE